MTSCRKCNSPIDHNWSKGNIYCRSCNGAFGDARRARRKRHLRRYMKSVGCYDCGYNDNVYALQWDHEDPSTKLGNVMGLVNRKLKILMDEARKCKVRCANCHAIRTHNENHLSTHRRNNK